MPGGARRAGEAWRGDQAAAAALLHVLTPTFLPAPTSTFVHVRRRGEAIEQQRSQHTLLCAAKMRGLLD